MPPPTPPAGEHLIRLRGGWERDEPGRESAPERLTLPLAGWPADWGVTRLVRHFHHPPLEPSSESLGLRLASVPGLVAVVLDGIVLATPSPPDSDRLFPVDLAGPRRHTLELTVDPARFGRSAPAGIWGEIALIVQSRPEVLGGRTEVL